MNPDESEMHVLRNFICSLRPLLSSQSMVASLEPDMTLVPSGEKAKREISGLFPVTRSLHPNLQSQILMVPSLDPEITRRPSLEKVTALTSPV